MMHIGDRKPKVYLYGRNRVARIVILVSFCVQIAKCRVLENFQGLKVRGRGRGLGVRGRGLLNWSSRILEDEDFPRGQQLCHKHCPDCYHYYYFPWTTFLNLTCHFSPNWSVSGRQQTGPT